MGKCDLGIDILLANQPTDGLHISILEVVEVTLRHGGLFRVHFHKGFQVVAPSIGIYSFVLFL